jgi:signal transduction histidine kinase/CheY-like chemotaxis protein
VNNLCLPQSVIDRLPVAICICSAPSGRILQFNRAAAELWGREPELDCDAARYCGALKVLTGDGVHVSPARTAMAGLLETGVPVRGLEGIVVRPDGSQRKVIANIDAIRDQSGKIIGAMNLSQDITAPESEAALRSSELHAMRKKTQLLEAQLFHTQKMEAVGQLAGGVAHDFNNLLMVISSQAELLLDVTDRERVETKARRILSATESAGQLTRKLLAFGRKQQLASSTFDLNQLISDTTDLIKDLLPKNIAVDARLSAQACWVNADRVQMEQTLINLVLNARDAMPGGGRLILSTSAVAIDSHEIGLHGSVPAGDYALITVADTGQGIPEELLGRIFEPFFTTKTRERGTGLGLSIAHGIVSQSGGHLRVHSSVNAGTTFSIYLPTTEPPAKEQPNIRPCPLGRSNASCAREGTILVVDDEDLVRRSVRMFLEQYGLNVVDCADATDALRIGSELKDGMVLLITDCVMPKMTGSELAQSLVSHRPELPIIFMSGYAAGEIGHERFKGAKFLQKPFTRAMLMDTVCKGLQTCPRRTQN